MVEKDRDEHTLLYLENRDSHEVETPRIEGSGWKTIEEDNVCRPLQHTHILAANTIGGAGPPEQ